MLLTGRSLARLSPAVAAWALLGLSRGVAAQGFTVSGYADFETTLANVGSDDTEFFFDNHHFNLILVGTFTEDLFAAAELEYEHGGDETALEYGYFGYTGFEDVRIIAGKFIVPFGRFNKDLHPTPLNKIPARPYGFAQVLPQTYSDIGLWVSGAKAIGTDNRFVFDVYAVNGLLGDDGDNIRSLRDNVEEEGAFGVDDDKALGARLGVEMPFTGLDVGASVYTGKYAVSETTGESLRLLFFGGDASYQKDGFVLRGEVVTVSQDVTGGDLRKTGGYVQASYRTGNGKVEPVVRFSSRNMPSTDTDASRFALGVGLYVSSSSIVRVAYLINTEKEGFEQDNNGLVAQFNVLF